MNQQEKLKIIEKAKDWMRSSLISNHRKNTIKLSSLKEFKINPFLWPYLANYYKGNTNYRSLAEVLILPRVLGTSITTTFGSNTQQFITTLFSDMNLGSAVSGIDIQFKDAIDGRMKYCQLKAGPNALNKDDVKTVSDHFIAVRNLSRTNGLNIQLEDLVLGILYGEPSQMNPNIKEVAKKHTLYAGQEFWYRLTGDEDFYEDMALAMGEVADEVDVREVINDSIDKLALEIKEKYPDISKSKKI